MLYMVAMALAHGYTNSSMPIITNIQCLNAWSFSEIMMWLATCNFKIKRGSGDEANLHLYCHL